MQHYYSQEQSSKLSLRQLNVTTRGISLEIYTASGTFSKTKIDTGSLLLINSMIIKPGWQVLDLGCGYGVLGLFAAKLAKTSPYLIDINKRAYQLARLNAKINKIKATVLNGNIYEPVKDKRFDTILLNPPQTAGKDVCMAMIDESISHLKKSGLLQLVARPNKGGKSLASRVQQVFGNIKIIAKKSGYAVYVAKHL